MAWSMISQAISVANTLIMETSVRGSLPSSILRAASYTMSRQA